jgi:hypothetical protein
MDGALVIDVATSVSAAGDDAIVVAVEPLYGVPAVALALDAGWDSVELAEPEPDVAPIPLVSFEQPARGARCRVRCADLLTAIEDGMLLGAPVLARPLASRIAATPGLERVTFLPAPAAGELVTVDGWWAAGMLIRVLLEELDDRPSRLTDAAGLAVTVAQGAEDPGAQLTAGVRWRRHLEAGGHADDLRIASAVDSVGVIPHVTSDGDALIAVPWPPALAAT